MYKLLKNSYNNEMVAVAKSDRPAINTNTNVAAKSWSRKHRIKILTSSYQFHIRFPPPLTTNHPFNDDLPQLNLFIVIVDSMIIIISVSVNSIMPTHLLLFGTLYHSIIHV